MVAAQGPRPQSFEPRKSPVKHLGPAPQPPGGRAAVRATRPMPVVRQPGGQPAAVRPGTVQPTTVRPGADRPLAGRAPTVGQRPGAGGAPRPARHPRAGRRTAGPPGSRPVRQAAAHRLDHRARSRRPRRPRRRPWPLRLLGALLRWVPRLLLLGSVYVLLTQTTTATPYLSAPGLAVAAFGVAALLRAAGHRMRVWFYVVAALLVGVVSAALWAGSTGLLPPGWTIA
nr:hypothetical protein GCM10025730_07820 [Promicromonospora thailandica]